MDPRLRTALAYAAASLLAAVLGWQIAEASYAWASLASVALTAAVLVRFTGLSADVILVGFLIVGYIVGNRGFAQLTPTSGLPLLPAELGLLVATSWRVIQWSFERRLPIRRDALNWAVAAWLVVGTARVGFDVPHHGLLAVRDYAMVYYAVFFFVAQHMVREAGARRYLVGCFTIALGLLWPVHALSVAFPNFFFTQLTVQGAPLIYHKGDLAFTFLAIAALVVFHAARGTARVWAWPVAAGMFLYVAGADNRAALAAALAAAALLMSARRWQFPALQAGLTAGALAVVVMLATLADNTWADQKLRGTWDRVQSMTDFTGVKTYTSEESSFKGDNNRFRLIWWKNVVQETWATNPVLGLGFGTDLAHGFVQEYYPDNAEEFGIRSPHNIFVTTFGRLGLAGLTVWVWVCAMLVRGAWRSVHREDDPVQWSLWCALGMILCAASVGVVLEGPMGAVVFWTMLGVAHGYTGSETAADHPAARSVAETSTAPLPERGAGI